MEDRYKGRPLYIFLENLILHCIGELSQNNYDGLQAMEGKLQCVYGRDGSWIEIIKAELSLPNNFEEKMLVLWNKNKIIARENNIDLSPIDFARMIVDDNFSTEGVASQ